MTELALVGSLKGKAEVVILRLSNQSNAVQYSHSWQAQGQLFPEIYCKSYYHKESIDMVSSQSIHYCIHIQSQLMYNANAVNDVAV